jgi:UDP-glucose 4-epimerase
MNEDKTILVTGGSGYIGSVTCKLLVDSGYNVINIDRVKREQPGVSQYPFDIDNHQLKGVIQLTKPDAIIHLAADHSVPNSISSPDSTYFNNVANSVSLLKHAVDAGVKHFVFSSSSSVYGNTDGTPSEEIDSTNPITPYGKSKAMIESILEDFSNAFDFTYTSLRYFNAAGSYEGLGYRLDPKEHLVPIVVDCALNDSELTINGDDYATVDGTCQRDYTHVLDIAMAHVAALNYLFDGGDSNVFNVGGGNTTSIKQVIAEVEKQTGKTIKQVVGPKRIGDPAITSANISKANELLGWSPTQSLETIISTELEYATDAK